jgi:hypothetical protein
MNIDEYTRAHVKFVQNAVNKARIMEANWRRCRSKNSAAIAATLCKNTFMMYNDAYFTKYAQEAAEKINAEAAVAVIEKQIGNRSFRKKASSSEILKFMRHNGAWVEDSLPNGGFCWRNRHNEWCGIYFM